MLHQVVSLSGSCPVPNVKAKSKSHSKFINKCEPIILPTRQWNILGLKCCNFMSKQLIISLHLKQSHYDST